MEEKHQLKKTPAWKIILFVIALAAIIASFVCSPLIYGENSWFQKTDTGIEFLNSLLGAVPSAICTVQVIIIAMLVYGLIIFVLKKSVHKSNRGLTIIKMLSSFLKWIVVIVAFLCILGAWGVDVVTLVAGAGILTLVIGFGAQSLIADVIAGIFIVVEGGYQIGDIVIIDGWRGTVQEIGMRTTKLIDAGGDIRVINNSLITAYTNQTRELSVAKVYMNIEYGEDLPKVEQLIKDNLEAIGKRVPGIVNTPEYLGVSELGASSVTLFIKADCHEEDIFQIQRDLNREFKLLFDENGINIPFPQIVVNERK